MLTARFDQAVAYANAVHAAQKRKSTQIPYLSHLLGVSSIVLENGGNEDEAIAALLHDAAEDQGGMARLQDIRARFGPRVAEIVEACSDSLEEDPKKKAPYHDRKARYHAHLREHRDASFYLVSAADKLHNARAMAQDERSLGPELWKRFSAGKPCVLWNLRTLEELYTGLHDARVTPVAGELRRVISDLSVGCDDVCPGVQH